MVPILYGPEQEFVGQTALMFAAESSHLETVEALLAAGADPNIEDRDGGTALIAAAGAGHTGVVARLLAAGADADTRMSIGGGALNVAVRGNHVEVARLLLAAGAAADIDATGQMGMGLTPLTPQRGARGQAAWNHRLPGRLQPLHRRSVSPPLSALGRFGGTPDAGGRPAGIGRSGTGRRGVRRRGNTSLPCCDLRERGTPSRAEPRPSRSCNGAGSIARFPE
ncbi:MAG: ankyrin repeat domain-containing protein [bacterium]|nr:ankyrin repeat domain-containing protein [bacterium]